MLTPQMTKPQINHCYSPRLFFLPNSRSACKLERTQLLYQSYCLRKNRGLTSIRCMAGEMKGAIVQGTSKPTESTKLEAILTVRASTVERLLDNLSPTQVLDNLQDLLGRSLLLELISSELDPESGSEKKTISAYARKVSQDGGETKYESSFTVPNNFGEIGGVFVTNVYHNEIFLQDLILQNDKTGAAATTISCNSWIQPKSVSPDKRVFFTTKSYLPDQTPSGLKSLRNHELELKRGNGKGERKSTDRIYDYDTYNDLGDPDSEGRARPILGGTKVFPYPRRCRTGRPQSQKDPKSETRSSTFYVPRDEDFSKVKQLQFSTTTLTSVLHAALPSAQSFVIDTKSGFPNFNEITVLYNEGFQIPKVDGIGFFQTLIPRIYDAIQDVSDKVLRFDVPEMLERDRFSWLRDEEFARQTLAGINPYAIQLVKELPMKSKLDPAIYGAAESAITTDIIEKEINGIMTAEEAVHQKRLFVVDYHDLLLPYVHKVRALEGTTLYGSRSLFFLTDEGILKPIAIELTRPPSPTAPEWRHVFVPSSDSTGSWLWKLAKAQVCAHDSGHHELISHWLRTHCSVEPYIIAMHRQLSEMHPIYRLLHRHFRYTMKINAFARQALISAGGIIESSFSPLKYSMELSTVAYDQTWRFDLEALPADLIRRGMAVEDPTAEHGLKLVIDDYPFANDGLLIWSAIKKWVQEYISHYYPDSAQIKSDTELQAWWHEVRTRGHADKKDEPWWPTLDTQESLTQTLTTIIWVASAHHAAVNFGQYDYAGFFPNRPTIARINIPTEDMTTDQLKNFLQKPEDTLLDSFPTQIQATVVMAVLNLLSTHSSDEEYLGGQAAGLTWLNDPVMKAAYDRFYARLKEIEGIIDARNLDPKFRNRSGAGMVPYKLMKPFSDAGVTGMGIPNSISI
ncbi:Lipoxygenase [Rhynchospora pubera]|uniref:linoleate 13S-lipoxygenase n=1 Tax=Rhynchospora pubera TaxID=906938 RepID=A0AAV8CVW0_9POAL|nr:Lipoxygenase [Rhynchospora pubera]